VDFTTRFETVYDLLSEDDHVTLRRVLDDRSVTDASAADLEDGSYPSDAGDGVATASAAVDCAPQDLYLVCRMNAATSLRRVSPVSYKPYRLKVCVTFMLNVPHRPYRRIIKVLNLSPLWSFCDSGAVYKRHDLLTYLLSTSHPVYTTVDMVKDVQLNKNVKFEK